FQLELLPAEHAALDQRRVYGGELQRALDVLLELRPIEGHAPAGATQREGRADDGWIPDLRHRRERVLETPHGPAERRGEAEAPHRRRELRPVLRHLDRAGLRAD